MKFILIISTLIISSTSSAAVRITGMSGFSRGEGPRFNNANLTQNTVYGGISGSEDDCTTKDNINPCNSCVGTTLADCNSTRIYNNLRLSVTYLSDSTTGRILVTNDSDDSQVALSLTTTDNTDYPPNSIVTVSITWGEICNKLFGATGNDCDTATLKGSKNIRIGFDNQAATDNIGKLLQADDDFVVLPIILADMNATSTATLCNTSTTTFPANLACNFLTYPGDQKVFIEEVRTGCSFPKVADSDAADIRAIRVLHKIGGYPDTSTTTFSDLPISETNQACTSSKVIGLSENEVGGLENGENYFFKLALVDEANNVGFFTDNTNLDDEDSSTCFDSNQHKQNCHFASPAQVVGLFEDEFDCFITTATYGSPFKPKVKAFREFRNLFLKPNLLGSLIIQSYYKVSPPIASWIRNNPQSKPIVRSLLWPYWMISKFLLLSRHFVALLMALAFFLVAFRIYFKKKAL